MNWPFKPGATIGSVLNENRGLGPGFDYIRLGLALLIFNAHAGAIAAGRPEENLLIINNVAARAIHHWISWREPIYVALVPAFFAVSGFLVTSSAFRLKNVRSFLAFRALRIFPALSIEVFLSAIVLGPLFTTMPLSEYFTDGEFYRYFGNILGFVHYFLPDVFVSNPIPRIVNNSLWTLPPEFWCYLILSALMAASVVYSRVIYTVMFVVGTVIFSVFAYTHDYGMFRGPLEPPAVVYYFFCGCLVYHWRDHIPLNITLYVAAGLLSYALISAPRTVTIAPLVITYFTIAVGMTQWPSIPLVKSGDYSYGIYLYGFPLTQALAASAPGLTHHTVWFRMSAFVLTIVFAVLSWHFLEKPALRLKAYLVPSRSKLPPTHLEGIQGSTAP